MNKATCKVFIIDDEQSVRRSLSMLLQSYSYPAETFSSAEEFLDLKDYAGAGCILLDIFLDGRSGLELQEEINKKFTHLPIIYITGQGDIPMSVQAIKRGAFNFLQKPVEDLVLIKAVEEALEHSAAIFRDRQEIKRVNSLLESLTSKEFQVFQLLITGLLNKQIAAELNIAEHTVKIHRGKVTEKLGVKSVAELVQLAHKLNLI